MKPQPAPSVPGNSEAARMDFAVRKMFSVSKEDFLKKETKYQEVQAQKKRAKKQRLKRPKFSLSRHYERSASGSKKSQNRPRMTVLILPSP